MSSSTSVTAPDRPAPPACGGVRPVVAVSAAMLREGQVLMVRRGHAPNAGRLALPGGKVEPGETLLAAAARELFEETGVRGRPLGILTALEVMDHAPGGELRAHYVIVVVRFAWAGGIETPGDDASELRWMGPAALDAAGTEVCEEAGEIARTLLAEAADAESSLNPG